MATKSPYIPFDGMTQPVYESLWKLSHLRFDPQRPPQDTWAVLLETLDSIEAADRLYPGHLTVLHKRLNCLDDGLELLVKHPDLVPPEQLLPIRLRFATECIARVPSRFAKNTPFGAACVSAWVRGHRTFARHADSAGADWKPALAEFDAAVTRATNAPRTHSEGNLKSADRHKELLALGPSMPWMDRVRESAAALSLNMNAKAKAKATAKGKARR